LGSVGYVQFLDLTEPNHLAVLGGQICKELCNNAGAFLLAIFLFGVKGAVGDLVLRMQLFFLTLFESK
jgi:hypothetical protein